MAQQDLGGSCTAQRYCHSEARISGHVMDEHGGVSENNATMMALTFCVRNRHSSYSHSVLSTFSGGCASLRAISLSTATLPFRPTGCVRKWCRALRCSVSWKAESIYASCPVSKCPCALLTCQAIHLCAYLRQLDERRALCHVLRHSPWPYTPSSGMVEVAEELLLLGGGWHRRQLVLGDGRGTGQAGRSWRRHCCRGPVVTVGSDNSMRRSRT